MQAIVRGRRSRERHGSPPPARPPARATKTQEQATAGANAQPTGEAALEEQREQAKQERDGLLREFDERLLRVRESNSRTSAEVDKWGRVAGVMDAKAPAVIKVQAVSRGPKQKSRRPSMSRV